MGHRPESFLLWGAGGHGRVVADVVRSLGHQVAGYVDIDPSRLGQVAEPGGGRVVVLQDEFLEHLRKHDSLPLGADRLALAIGSNRLRWEWLRLVESHWLPPVIHPTAIISATARIGRGTVVMPRVVVNAGARVGSGVILNTGAIVEHDCDVADGVHLSPAATLCGAVRVGERSWIAAGSTVIPEVTIGADAVVGAGSVVISTVLDGTTVVGCPAKPKSKGM